LFILDILYWSEFVALFAKKLLRSLTVQPEPVSKTRTAIMQANRGIFVMISRAWGIGNIGTDQAHLDDCRQSNT
jgi:hypothetical protein